MITKDLINDGRQLWNNTKAKLDDYGNECLAKCSKDDVSEERPYELIVRMQEDRDSHADNIKMQRINDWRQRMRDSLTKIKGYAVEGTHALKREDG